MTGTFDHTQHHNDRSATDCLAHADMMKRIIFQGKDCFSFSAKVFRLFMIEYKSFIHLYDLRLPSCLEASTVFPMDMASMAA